ncbi:hypothetical protein CTI14_12225, partial [Methylobacterium radiotolerans]
MRNGSPEDEANARRRAELCALADGRDTDTGRDADVADAAPTDRLGELGDALLAAYQLAEQDGDPLTVALLEQALL